MRNCTKNTAIGEASARREAIYVCEASPHSSAVSFRSPKGRSAIATEQLPLFVGLPTFEEELPPYPLQIKAIPPQNRFKPNNYCKLVHFESGLNIPGQFTYDEAKEILETTRYWDFSLLRDRIPRCVERLRLLLEDVCARSLQVGGKADA